MNAILKSNSALGFLSGGGEMGALIRAHDWSRAGIGAPHRWPQALRTVVRLMLSTNHPVFVFWGPELLCFYNDAYKASLGPEKHPRMLGAPGREMWPESWRIIGPQIEQVMAGGPATWHENQLVPIVRNGRLEEIYWTYSYSSIDHDGGVGGVLVLCTETTAQVMSEKARAREAERLHDLFRQTPTFVAVMRGPEHRFEFVNEAFKALFLASDDIDITGRTVAEAFPEAAQQGFVALPDEVYRTKEAFAMRGARFTVEASAAHPAREYFLDQIYKPLLDERGAVTGVLAVGYDMSDRVRAEAALRESEQRYRDVVDAQSEMVCRFEAGGRILFANKAYAKAFGVDRDSIVDSDLWSIIPEANRASVRALLIALTPERPERRVEQRRETPEGAKWTLWTTKALRFNADGTAAELQATGVDITERKVHEEHRNLLIQELNHRVKNTLAVVQSLANQSFKHADSIADMRARFDSRLSVLAAAHRCLTETQWGPTPLREVVESALAICRQSHGRAVLEGPPVQIQPKVAVSLALALHELCTNAIKYGALSNETGWVSLRWTLHAGERHILRLEWIEEGGPEVAPPKRRGFGSVMIERVLRQDLGGAVDLQFLPAGVRCLIEADLDLDTGGE